MSLRWLYPLKRWMYRAGRPGWLARVANRAAAGRFAAGTAGRDNDMTLEVLGRRSGRILEVPVVVADLDGERYLVAMLGPETNWVLNVQAAKGRAALVRGERESVVLVEIGVSARPAILRRYLEVAPGARPHIPIGRDAPMSEFERIAPMFPVYRVTPVAEPSPTPVSS